MCATVHSNMCKLYIAIQREKWVVLTKKVMVPSLKWQVKVENVYSQCGKCNYCLRGKMLSAHVRTQKYIYAHRHTLGFSFCYTFICPTADSWSMGSPDKKSACACACRPVCVHFIFQPTCQTTPGIVL